MLLTMNCRFTAHVAGEIYETNKNLLKKDKTRDDFVHEQHLLIQKQECPLMGCGHKVS